MPGTPVQGALARLLLQPGLRCERRGAADAGARVRGRPDKPALCGLFERHDGTMHFLRIRGIRRAPPRPGRASAARRRAPVCGGVQVLGLMTGIPPLLRCVVCAAARSSAPAHACAQRAHPPSGRPRARAREAGPRVRR